MYRRFILFLATFIISVTLLSQVKNVEETFTYFPPDPSASFVNASTNLLVMQQKNEEYVLRWRMASELDRKAYLRQDIGLLYENGRLLKKIGDKWKQYDSKIEEVVSLNKKESGFYDAISFHHAELHKDETITSTSTMSADSLYVIDSKFSPLTTFRIPANQEEKQWKKTLDSLTENVIQKVAEKAQKTYAIDLAQYNSFILTETKKYQSSLLPGFTIKQTEAIIGRLWEGMYKNYFLGVRKANGKVVDPTGSTVPIVLISKDHSHLLVLTEIADGEIIMLRQQLQVD